MRINHRDRDADREMLLDYIPMMQYGDRHSDLLLAMDLLEDQFNDAYGRYVEYQRNNGTPPSEPVTAYVYPSNEQVHAKVIHQSQVTEDSTSNDTIQLEWDSDASHHFIGTKTHFLPGTFVKSSMKLQVANCNTCTTVDYGALNHPMLKKVWYIKKFGSNLFSDVQEMKDGYSCKRVGNKLENVQGETTVLTGVFKSNRWVLNFD